MAVDNQSNSPIFGLTNHPWDLGRTPGGSSAGLSPLGRGSDIARSIILDFPP